MAIWGDFAAKFDLGPDEHPIISIKRVSLCEYLGKTLNTNDESQFLLDPPHPRAQQIREWYKNLEDPSKI